MKKVKHPYKPCGFHVTLNNGRMFSCIDLSKVGICYGVAKNTGELIGQLYDLIGGRFEALEIDSNDWDIFIGDPFRAPTMDELLASIEALESK